ncbi:MAG: terminase small subunit [Oscillospiraceae bacterium]|jgi:hypothetical protein|nr:terminase small subunit [Oscillospiraceae bacterium]
MLTERQARFAAAYSKLGNVSAAAKKSGYSKRRARELMRRKDVLAHIASLSAEERPCDAETVLRMLSRIAAADIFDFVRVEAVTDGEGKTRHDYALRRVAPGQGATLAEMNIAGDGSLRVRLYDKLRALELLGRAKRLFAAPQDTGEAAEETELTPAQAEELLRDAAKLFYEYR